MATELLHRRMCAQGLSCPSSRAHDAVHQLTAVQAQDRPASLWALGMRTSGATITDVEDAVASRYVVRTWMMRGTLHFAAAEDVRWILELVAPRLIARSRRRAEELHLDALVYGRSREIFTKMLERQGQASRSDLMAALEDKGISTSVQRGYHILWHLALEGTICFGPRIAKEDSFVLMDDWIPKGKSFSPEDALEELAVRYFTGHGPALTQDLVWWSGLTLTEVSKGVDAAGPRLHREVHGGITCLSGPSSPTAGEGPRVLLLPAFDEYVIGYRERGALLDREHTSKVLSSNGIFYPALVIDGRVQGTWRGRRSRKGINLEVRPFHRLSPSEMLSLEEASTEYGRFLGLPVKTSIDEARS